MCFNRSLLNCRLLHFNLLERLVLTRSDGCNSIRLRCIRHPKIHLLQNLLFNLGFNFRLDLCHDTFLYLRLNVLFESSLKTALNPRGHVFNWAFGKRYRTQLSTAFLVRNNRSLDLALLHDILRSFPQKLPRQFILNLLLEWETYSWLNALLKITGSRGHESCGMLLWGG